MCKGKPQSLDFIAWFRVSPGSGKTHSRLRKRNLLDRTLERELDSFRYRIVKVGIFQSLSLVQLFGTSWTAGCQASPSFTISWSLLKHRSIESVMPSSNRLIHCHSLLLLPSIFPSIRVFSNESVLHIRLAKVLELQLQR